MEPDPQIQPKPLKFTGSENLLEQYQLSDLFKKFCTNDLPTTVGPYLTQLAGDVTRVLAKYPSDMRKLMQTANPDIIEVHFERFGDNVLQNSFALQPGSPSQDLGSASSHEKKHKHKHKHRHKEEATTIPTTSQLLTPSVSTPLTAGVTSPSAVVVSNTDDQNKNDHKKHKKKRKHEEDETDTDAEKKKKKKKKSHHSSEHISVVEHNPDVP